MPDGIFPTRENFLRPSKPLLFGRRISRAAFGAVPPPPPPPLPYESTLPRPRCARALPPLPEFTDATCIFR